MFGRGNNELTTFEPNVQKELVDGVNVYSFEVPVDETPILIGRPTTEEDLQENGVGKAQFVPILNANVFGVFEGYFSRQAMQLEFGKGEPRVVRPERGSNQLLVFNAGRSSVRPLGRGDSKKLPQPIEGNDVILFDNGLKQPLAVLTFLKQQGRKSEMALIPLASQDPEALSRLGGVASDAVHFALALGNALKNIEWNTWRTRSGSTVLERDLFLDALRKIDSIKDGAKRDQRRQLLFSIYEEGDLNKRKQILMEILKS